MSERDAAVVRHYQSRIADAEDGVRRFAATVDALDRAAPTSSDLAHLDQFHVGGLAATAELARRAKLRPGMKVLDAGSGLGGPARFLAEREGCVVTGIDVSPAYVAIATLLAERAGLDGRVDFRLGNLIALPLPDAAFDVVWTQHVAMNVADRDALYAEFHRVLMPAGTLAWYDVLAVEEQPPPYYPLPWSRTPATSTLLDLKQTVAALERAGFAMLECDDVTLAARDWLAPQRGAVAPSGAGIVIGSEMPEMVANLRRSVAEGRVRLVMGVCRSV